MAKGKIKYTSQAIANETFDATNRMKKILVYGMNGSTPVPLAVDALGGLAGTLTNVDLSIPATDGQTLVFNAAGSYTATVSPLTFNGSAYSHANLGIQTEPCEIFLYSSNPAGITADGQTINTETSTSNLHAALVNLPSGGGKSTFYVTDAVASDSSALASILVSQVDASATVDNFKANAFTYNSGASYTWNGFTGFDNAGTIAVLSGETTPPAINYVAPADTWVAGTNYVPHHFSIGIFQGNQDTKQVVANNSATTLALTTATLAADSYFTLSNDGSETFQLNNQIISGGRGVIVVNTPSVITSGIIELQKQNQDASWTTQYAGTGSSMTFPFDYGDGQHGFTFRARFTQTSGASISVYAELHMYWDV